ncbi:MULTISPECIES: LysR family transcriptional regulator [unclassified Saccharopolyspora]|uniref:LysR family transcriptional regulator n=1 Tax=unclassified Saccharopolyspora TaxID=2646250 RepID=UPI001CD5EBEC|nr:MULTISPECIES: LysR family transcriptional regulator [unclassified Saccharopolyspora]MCA1187181.1 LysR family transcriptional regulator [Saccharopolyspora sp. 6T]MCA1195818.1 LysR family transcriptional regulator [Saccharopolyspora sp. 6V]
MDARQLEYFVTIVDEGGFHRAAERLHVAQPSLSQAVRTLERDVGVALFHRLGRRAVLTEAGRAMLEPARQVLRDLDTTRASVESVQGLRSGRVQLAVLPSQSVQPLTAMIGRFHAECPDVLVSVQPAFTPSDAADLVRGGRSELGLIGAAEDFALPGLRSRLVERQRFVVVTAPGGPWEADRAVLRRADLAGQRVITSPEGNRMRHVVDEIIAQGVDLRIVVETAHREAILPLVLAGTGIAVLTAGWAEFARAAGARVLDLEPVAELRISLIHRPAPLTPAAQRFLDLALAREELGPASEEPAPGRDELGR